MADPLATDRLLAQRLAAGDRQACAQLVQQHHAAVYGLLARLCRDAHLAEDLTQETFATCWTTAARFRGDCPVAAWLRKIAYHKFIDWQRRQTRTPGLFEAAAMEAADREALAAADDPAAGLLAGEEQRRLHQALTALGTEDYQAVVLHYLEGLSFHEMAELLEQPVGTVKWRVSHALNQLRQRLNAKSTHECESR